MKEVHIGKICPYCQFPIKQDSEVTLCSACRVPHHRECWIENEGCTTFGCNETTFRVPSENRLEIILDENEEDESIINLKREIAELKERLDQKNLELFKLLGSTEVADLNGHQGQKEQQKDISSGIIILVMVVFALIMLSIVFSM